MYNNQGFTLVEVIFAFSITSVLLVGLITGVVGVKSLLRAQEQKHEERIMIMEKGLNELFYPVEDVEWAISLVLP